MCSYHGWEFNQQGICVRIPQAENPNIVSQNQANFCVTVFPTKIANDLLWVWADPQSPELAITTPLPLSPQIDADKGFVWSSLVRDLEYDWATLIENIVDPAHVPFAHHGVQGNRNQAVPIAVNIINSEPNLIRAEVKRFFTTTITFQPPCRVEYAIGFGEQGQQLGLITYCLPVVPGKSRIIAQFSRNFAVTLSKLIPRWWTHIQTRNLVLDGDMILLSQQEKLVNKLKNNDSWQNFYKIPTQADRFVMEFHRWFDIYCQGQLPWDKQVISETNSTPIGTSRQQLLDRYHQHTQHCSSCRNALQTIKNLQFSLIVYVVLATMATAVMPDTLRLNWGIWLMAIALISLGIFASLKFWLEPKFYFVDYIHSDKK